MWKIIGENYGNSVYSLANDASNVKQLINTKFLIMFNVTYI